MKVSTTRFAWLPRIIYTDRRKMKTKLIWLRKYRWREEADVPANG